MSKRFLMALALCVSVALASGCAKVQSTPESDTGAVAPAADTDAAGFEAAARIVADGIVYFDFDKYTIKEEFRPMLGEVAKQLKAYPNMHVRIEGNCDSRGTQEYNLALGERRAQAAYEYLVMLGVNPSQLEIISYGKERPAVEGNNAAAWAKNRRDNFAVTK